MIFADGARNFGRFSSSSWELTYTSAYDSSFDIITSIIDMIQKLWSFSCENARISELAIL